MLGETLTLILLAQGIIGHGNGPVVVKEEKDAVLPCSLKDTPLNYLLFDWKKDDQQEVFMYDGGIHYNNGRGGQDPQFKGRVSHFQDELQHGNASIKIRNTKVEDSGDYSCVFPRLQSSTSPLNHVELIVERVLKDRSVEIPGAASKPSFPRDFEETEAGVILQCDVRDASPKPRVEWRDRAGSLLHAEEPQVTEVNGSFNVTLLSSVNQSGHFHCVVTQEEIHHQVSAETNVHIKENSDRGSSPTWLYTLLGGLGVVPLLIAVLCLLKHFGCITLSCSRGPSQLPTGPTDCIEEGDQVL